MSSHLFDVLQVPPVLPVLCSDLPHPVVVSLNHLSQWSPHDLTGSGFRAILDVTFSSAPLASLSESTFEL